MSVVVAGVDVGAYTTKVVLLNEKEEVLGRALLRTGGDLSKASEEAYREALEAADLSRSAVNYVVSTGFGRYLVPFRNIQVTDLTAHARGIVHYFPQVRSILDIGNQSTRAFRIEPNGRVKVFRLNDKCAAGAGAFLLRVARYLEVPLEEIGAIALRSQDPQVISSVCAVLAETEIINQISAGTKLEDILKGAFTAIADQSLTLLRRVGVESEVALSGGVSKNPGVVKSLEEGLGQRLRYNAEGEEGSLYAGAVGAALLGLVRAKR
ncbi:MAG: 2-hydroxyglutaryl-CoA dehydratase [Candidatus Tectomicrobia bacterium]|uniref:2-hydroxyglutaryl-CoA dehydratase n=1 Tax=Tectimicrobiota bacterium TaxID=2528274 RepID=A0A932FXI7_UNCTE|nr:2-hydroxyglutaryl-CoA dehydratase [Candidatus Tectomicrobia bacterium]